MRKFIYFIENIIFSWFLSIGLKFHIFNLKNKFIILSFHRIVDNSSNGINLQSPLINASTEEFEREIIFLKKHFNIISFDYLLYCLGNRNPLPPQSLLITFDDGYKDNYLNAFPIVKKYSIPIIIFVSTNPILNLEPFWQDKVVYLSHIAHKQNITLGGLGRFRLSLKKKSGANNIAEIIEKLLTLNDADRKQIIEKLIIDLNINLNKEDFAKLYLSENDIYEMSKEGITFGAHTCSHPDLNKIELEKARSEIVDSKMKLEGIIKSKVKYFAYPGDARGFNKNIVSLVKECGFQAAVMAGERINSLNNHLDLFTIKRVSGGKSLMDLKSNIVKSLMPKSLVRAGHFILKRLP